MERKLFVGIDPGKSGAIVILDEQGEIAHKQVVPTIGKEYDAQAVKDILLEYDSGSNCTIHAMLEDVHAIQGSAGGTSNFNFGQGKMLWHMGLVCLEIPHTLIQPKAWQKEAWEGVPIQYKPGSSKKTKDTKATSLLAAKRLFPKADLTKSEKAKVPHDGIVDALLIAECCRRKFK